MTVHPLILYDYYRSSAAYRLRIALNLKGVEYRSRPVNLAAGEDRTADYRRRNPQGLVPALELPDGRLMTQSLAIIEYLEEHWPKPALLPEARTERARVRSLAMMVACDVHPLNNLRVLHYLTDDLGVAEAAKLAWYRHWVAEGLSALEARLTADGDTGRFCHGHQPGLADLCLVPQLYNARRFDCPLEAYPTLLRIEAACGQLSAFVNARPERQPDAV